MCCLPDCFVAELPTRVDLMGAGISAALDAECTLDGLMFLHQNAPYVMASNPFVLRWKDYSCSQWAVDTDANGDVQDDQHVVRSRIIKAMCQNPN